MEIWDGYLKNGQLAGKDLVRGEPIPAGLYHMVCYILVKHTDGDYLIMQRDYQKDKYAGYFEASAGGSALRGEDMYTCAKRELFEETGIKPDKLQYIYTTISHDTIYNIFLCITDCNKKSVKLQKGETIAFKWISEKDFIEFVNSDEIIDIQKQNYYDYFKSLGYIEE